MATCPLHGPLPPDELECPRCPESFRVLEHAYQAGRDVPCRGCDGDGFVQVPDPRCTHSGHCECGTEDVPCAECRGTGQETCWVCGDHPATAVDAGASHALCRYCVVEQEAQAVLGQIARTAEDVKRRLLGSPRERSYEMADTLVRDLSRRVLALEQCTARLLDYPPAAA